MRWSCTGPTSASRTTAPRCTGVGSSSRIWWAPPASSPWRTAAWAASSSAAPPRRARRCRSSTWAATRSSRRRRGPPRPRCAASGRPGGASWSTEMGESPLTAGSLSAALVQLNADYARAIDDDRLEDWPDFFTESCLYTITSADNHRQGLPLGVVYADGKAMVRDRVTALRRANIYERQAYRHVVGLPAIL